MQLLSVLPAQPIVFTYLCVERLWHLLTDDIYKPNIHCLSWILSHSMTGCQHRVGHLGDLPAGLAKCAACSADCTARLTAQGIRAIILPSLSVTLDATPCRTAPMISSAAFRILQGEGRPLSATEDHNMPYLSKAMPKSLPCCLSNLSGSQQGASQQKGWDFDMRVTKDEKPQRIFNGPVTYSVPAALNCRPACMLDSRELGQPRSADYNLERMQEA